MEKYFIVGALILGLLLTGCTTPGGSGVTGVTNNTGGTGGTGSSGTSGGSSGGTGGASTNGTGASGGSGGTGVLDLAGMGYLQLVALGIPVECQFSDNEQGVATQFTLKMKGDRIRGEGTVVSNGSTEPTTFISLPDAMYIQLSASQKEGITSSCDWIKFADSSAGSGSTEVNGVDANPAAGLTSGTAKYDCKPGLFGDDVFAVPQNACDMNELINSAVNAGGSNAPDICDSAQDNAQKIACKAECGAISDYVEKVGCAIKYIGG